MDITDFVIPNHHPYGMLNGYNSASEKENCLAYRLIDCMKYGNLDYAFDTPPFYIELQEDGLIERVDGLKYKLTKKALGLLYSQYHA